MKGFLLIVALSILSQTYGEILSACNGNLTTNDSGLDYSFYGTDKSCTYTVIPSGKEPFYLFFEILLLDENDKLTVTHGVKEKTIVPNALPILVSDKEITITVTLNESLVFRRIKLSYQNNSDFTYNLDTHQASLVISQPLNLLSMDSTCDLKFKTLNNNTLINSFINNFDMNSGSIVMNNITVTKENSGCEIIEETINLKVTTTSESPLTTTFQLELVNKACSGTLKKLDTFGTNTSLFDPKFPCRFAVLAMDQTQYIVVKLRSSGSKASNSYLQIKDGANRTSNSLLNANALSLSEASGEFMLATHGCLYVEANYANFTIELKDTNSAGVYSAPGSFSITSTKEGKSGVYFLQVDQGLQVVADFPTISGALNTYADTKTSISLYESNVSLSFPIISSTNKMFIIATEVVKDYIVSFKGTPKGCNQMGQTKENVYAYTYANSKDNCQPLCQFIVPPKTSSKDTLAIHVPAVQLDSSSNITLFEIGDKDSFVTVQSPISEIYVDSSKGFQMKIKKNCSSPTTNIVLNTLVDTLNECAEVKTIKAGESLTLTSPNYPSHYPLNVHCTTNVTSPSKYILVSVNDIDLSNGHVLRINSNIILNNNTDYITSNNDQVVFDGPVVMPKVTNATARGYNLNFTAVDCGGSMGDSSNELKASSNFCIWTIKGEMKPPVPKQFILQYKFSELSKTQELIVVDGGYSKLNKTIYPRNSTKTYYSLAENLIVFYKGDVNSTVPFSFKYNAIPCNHTCQNGLCLQDTWLCNGINECGDNSDELSCAPSPSPLPPVPKSGWSNGSFAAAIILSLIVGCTVAFAAPLMYQRYRSASYRQFTADIN